MEIKGFSLINEEKVERTLNGVPRSDGTAIGGVGSGAYFENGVWKREGNELSEEEVNDLSTAILAEYDKLGGAIKRGNDPVKTGSFYDFKGKKPFKNPKVICTYKVNGKFVDVPDGEEEPGEVKAAKILMQQEKEKQETETDEQPKKKIRRAKQS